MRYVLALVCLFVASSTEGAIFRSATVARSKVVSSGVRPLRGAACRSCGVSKSCVVVHGAVRCTP